ncbi:hypothetical protein [Adhaeretor mobilis]|nr:hypothetical protein [Adhaeretor mobilis]
MSEKICEVIRDAFQENAVSASRESQIRRRLVPKKDGGEPGSETDVFVSVPALGVVSGDPMEVVVEVKRSCNREAKESLRSQLVDRYMSEAGTDFGFYIVVYLDAPSLRDSHKPVWSTLEEAQYDIVQQAEAIETDTSGTTCVRPHVIDARIQ